MPRGGRRDPHLAPRARGALVGRAQRHGPEIEFFRRSIEAAGEPALDVACGTGRLLVPWLQAGLDVDGCDLSPDMLALCWTRSSSTSRARSRRRSGGTASSSRRRCTSCGSRSTSTQELLLLLEQAGFEDVTMRAGYEDREPTAEDQFVVFLARKAS